MKGFCAIIRTSSGVFGFPLTDQRKALRQDVTKRPIIKFEPVSSGRLWSGSDWRIANEDDLAVLIARVALGQHRHVQQILSDTDCSVHSPAESTFQGAIRLLTAKDPSNPWQRDGWLFQVISWIAANIQDPASLKAPPHMIPADKGFDGLHILIDESNGSVRLAVVCEEKATGDPRGKITSQVWPDFRVIESGDRDNELVSKTATLLAQNGHIDPDQAVHEILWNRVRAYRVSITIGDKERAPAGRKALFRGYKKVAPGSDVKKRRAETFHRKNLRKWMEQMAAKAIAALKEMEAEDV